MKHYLTRGQALEPIPITLGTNVVSFPPVLLYYRFWLGLHHTRVIYTANYKKHVGGSLVSELNWGNTTQISPISHGYLRRPLDACLSSIIFCRLMSMWPTPWAQWESSTWGGTREIHSLLFKTSSGGGGWRPFPHQGKEKSCTVYANTWEGGKECLRTSTFAFQLQFSIMGDQLYHVKQKTDVSVTILPSPPPPKSCCSVRPFWRD